jgi:hypothetical protein
MRTRIATYSQLTKDYPNKTVLKKLAEKYGTDSTSYHRELDKIVGPLFRINWYRIILDEAHAIKNAESDGMLQCILIVLGYSEPLTCSLSPLASKVCCELFGKYRWALSGTPLANSSQGTRSNLNHCREALFLTNAEMYPYMRFLQCDWTATRRKFLKSFFFGVRWKAAKRPRRIELTITG